MKPRLLLLAVFLAVPAFATLQPRMLAAQVQSTFRVSIVGITCTTPTIDSVVSMDGAGDEVFALANVAELSSRNTLVDKYVRRSLTYGDTTGRNSPFRIIGMPLDHGPGRIHAGSASPTGGMRAGDVIPDPRTTAPPWSRPRTVRERMIPMVVWEGQLRRGGADSNAVLIVPTVWELDNIDDLHTAWDQQIAIFQDRFVGRSSGFVTGATSRPLVVQRDMVLEWIPTRNDFDRPVGMAGGAFVPAPLTPAVATFVPAVMLLTFDSAVEAAASTARNASRRPGVVDIFYKDGENYGPGDYTLSLRVERISF